MIKKGKPGPNYISRRRNRGRRLGTFHSGLFNPNFYRLAYQGAVAAYKYATSSEVFHS